MEALLRRKYRQPSPHLLPKAYWARSSMPGINSRRARHHSNAIDQSASISQCKNWDAVEISALPIKFQTQHTNRQKLDNNKLQASQSTRFFETTTAQKPNQSMQIQNECVHKGAKLLAKIEIEKWLLRVLEVITLRLRPHSQWMRWRIAPDHSFQSPMRTPNHFPHLYRQCPTMIRLHLRLQECRPQRYVQPWETAS